MKEIEPLAVDFDPSGYQGAVLVLGCGRSGTNMALEILAGSSALKPTGPHEDREVLATKPRNSRVGPRKLDAAYLSKIVTAYIVKWEQLQALMELNPHLKLIWTIRDPRDLALSKFYRGRGHHSAGSDSHYHNCIDDIHRMMIFYQKTLEVYAERMHLVIMENVIKDVQKETRAMCTFLGIPYAPSMCDFYHRYRNEDKANRYKKIDEGQLALYKRVDTIYEGYFQNPQTLWHFNADEGQYYNLNTLFEALKPCIEYFNYEPATP